MANSYTEIPLHNPKRDKSNLEGRATWYPYYAGYAPTFVEDAIQYAHSVATVSRILDPWNGSGTTTDVARSLGITAEGFDLSPAMIIVAKAKTLNNNVQQSLVSLLDDICSKARSCRDSDANDPLSLWLNDQGIRSVRSVEKAIFALLVDRRKYRAVVQLPSTATVSALAAFFYLALFRTLRILLKPFLGSNPTWIKSAQSDDLRINLRFNDVLSVFREQLISMQTNFASAPLVGQGELAKSNIALGNSVSLPLVNASCDLVVSSPPYCTRIDYAVKTWPELAVLGVGSERFRSLREKMIGTPTIGNILIDPSPRWGSRCMKTLDKIRSHRSRASESYYWKTYIQYFDGLFRSLKEIGRTLKPSGLCFLVLQDSYYKDVRIDLANISNEMAKASGLQLIDKRDFRSKRTMAGLYTASRVYNQQPEVTESIMVWQRSGSRKRIGGKQ